MNRGRIVLICTASVAAALAYGAYSAPRVLHFIDGLSFLSAVILLGGLAIYQYKEGAFAFFSWKSGKLPFSEYRQKIRQERQDVRNDLLPAGIILLAVSLALTAVYMGMK